MIKQVPAPIIVLNAEKLPLTTLGHVYILALACSTAVLGDIIKSGKKYKRLH